MLSQHEKAIYGALSGQLSAILPVCSSWEDKLWAHCIASAEQVFHGFLLSRSGRSMARLPASSVDQSDFSLEEIFKEVEASDDQVWLLLRGLFYSLGIASLVEKE